VAHPLPDYERDSSLRELLRSARYARLRFAAPAGESGSTKAEQFTEKNLHRLGYFKFLGFVAVFLHQIIERILAHADLI
jgi:hypothetical protein